MATRKAQAVFQSFIGGMNGTIDPILLPENTYARGVNVTSRGGLPKTRPPFKDTGFEVADGKFQGEFTYRLNGTDRKIYGVAGHVYSLNLSTGITTDHGLLLSPNVDRFFFTQADRYLVVQDGDPAASWAAANWPVIIYEDGLIDQHTDTSPNYIENDFERVPKGGPMAFGHGRLFVATNYVYQNEEEGWIDKGRVGFMAGDIKLAYTPESLLRFAETWSLAEGGRFDLYQELGFIYAMDFQHNLMTGVGAGPMIVFAQNGASSYMVNAPRLQWKQIDFSVVMFSGSGTNSNLSFVHNNSDIIYRGLDGIRTLAQTSQESQGSNLTNKGISSEVNEFTVQDEIGDLPKVSMVKFNNRILMTTVPDTEGFKALVSLDVDALSSISTPPKPIYDGIWTGFEFLHVSTAKWNATETLFVFIRSEAGENGLYYMDESEYIDGTISAPQCRIYTAEKFFDNPHLIKRVLYAEMSLRNVKGEVSFTVYYRADGYPLWSKMSTGTVNSDPNGLNMRYTRIRLTPDKPSSGPQFGELLDTGWAVQFCIEWNGHAQIDLFRVIADADGVDTKRVACKLSGTDLVAADEKAVELNDYTYRVI